LKTGRQTERERESETDTQADRERETDRQTDTQTGGCDDDSGPFWFLGGGGQVHLTALDRK